MATLVWGDGARLVVRFYLFRNFQQWDSELAALAANNARRCVYGHDKCRNTISFPYAGQNIAMNSYSGQTFTVNELITGFVNDWFSEFKDANPSYVASYPKGYTGYGLKSYLKQYV